MTKKVILDCDPGHDDAISIILAASNISDLKIEAITTVAGNVEVEKNTQNTLKVCDMIGLTDVPVAQGVERPLVKEREIAEEIHGDTGLDGPDLPEIPTKQAIDQHGVDLIIEKVLNAGDDITLVPTGPLTNIALAMIKEPKIIPKIKEIVLMGGGTFGNWTPAAEFNIYVDAEAANVVFNSGVPISMFALDVTHQAIATDEIIEQLSNIDNATAHFVVELLVFFKKTYKEVFGFSGPPIHDACTVAYLLDPSIFKCQHVRVDVETKGEFSYGMTVVDKLKTTGKDPNVHFAYELNFDKFWDLMTKALQSYQTQPN
ncbi:nucleoside hydrolase [Texcoconibacillus texcoconensis]|uniref:Purine nucleosidase n=1 Tax=Texcoconibacillus texcoconensis TaxID=1095777 RepID=A0A840QM53_9BACI|nr:nucleoside hydrolase [Texcoconibacillus texcoconensis]MBB5172459.1 purine nucleosidase [Texcoconibacillus texcoconensis]